MAYENDITNTDVGVTATINLLPDNNYTYVMRDGMQEDNLEYMDYTLATTLNTYVPPVLIIVGTIGNIISLIIFRRDDFKKQSICFYAAAHCIINILVLFMGSGLMWISQVLNVTYIANLADWGCRLWQFIINVITYTEVWLVVCMSVDRFIIIWYPKKSRSMCTVFKAKLGIILVLIGLTVISVHSMWMYELMPHGCFIPHIQGDLHAVIWPWVTASFSAFIPLTLLFFFSLALLLGILIRYHEIGRPNRCTDVNHDITIATVVLVTLFFLFHTPPTVTSIINAHLPSSKIADREFMDRIRVAKMICDAMIFLNPTIPFFLFLMFSSAFRKELGQGILSLAKRVYKPRMYEVALTSASCHTDLENCSETTPL